MEVYDGGPLTWGFVEPTRESVRNSRSLTLVPVDKSDHRPVFECPGGIDRQLKLVLHPQGEVRMSEGVQEILQD